MLDPVKLRDMNGSPKSSSTSGKSPADRRPVSQKIRFSEAENQTLSERADAAGQSVAEYIRQRALGAQMSSNELRGAELSVLEREVEQLRLKCETLSVHKAEIERRLSATTAEMDGVRAADAGESAELRQRVKTMQEHLDAADRHVASMRSRLDQQSAEASRRIANLEGRLRDREAEIVSETKRLNSTLSSETTKLQKRIAELEEANDRLATEFKGATVAGTRQRHSLEGRVSSLLEDIDEMKKRHAEAIGDRDRTMTALRKDIENIRSVAASEQAQLRQSLSDSEMRRQREASQAAKTSESLKATLAAVERDAQSVRDAAAVEHRRYEAAIADERDRARRQLDARDEQRRKIEARAEAAEKQAAGATATATMEITRANQLEMRLNAERTARAQEIEALQQHSAALTAQLEADQNSNNLIIDELRLRLAEFEGEEAAFAAVASAKQRKEAVVAELAALRAQLEAKQSATRSDVADEDDATTDDEPENDARARINEVMNYARALENEVAELRADRGVSAEPASGHADDDGHENGMSSWRRNIFGGSARRARGG